MRLRYVTVTVTEGGADFDSVDSWEQVTFDKNPWYNQDGGKKVRQELEKAELGDEIQLDGCSVCFVLKGDH